MADYCIKGSLKLAERTNVRLDNARLIRPADDHNYDYGAAAIVGCGEETARRIVATWNACEGIPTEALECNTRQQISDDLTRLLAAAGELVEVWANVETDTYCHACDMNAPCDETTGRPTGPIRHDDDCPIEIIRRIVKKYER